MDLRCYSIACLRLLAPYAGGAPRVVSASARARTGHPGVDKQLFLKVAYPSGATGSGGSSMAHDHWDFHLIVTGTRRTIHVPDFPRPHVEDTLVLGRPGRDPVVEHLGHRSSYIYQLETFRATI